MLVTPPRIALWMPAVPCLVRVRQMHVAVEEAGQHRTAARVDDQLRRPRTAGRRRAGGTREGDGARGIREDDGIRHRVGTGPVDQPAVLDTQRDPWGVGCHLR